MPLPMKRITLLLSLLGLLVNWAWAQRTGYINSEEILNQIPEYQEAQQDIEEISQQWQQDLEEKYKTIEQMYEEYQRQEVLLPEDVRQERQEAIFAAEREAKEYREKKFGYDGELFTLQEAKLTPIQDRLFKAVETVAKRKRYNFIFDKAGEVTWLYTDASYDLSQDVLLELGIETEGNN
jgi:outer membrane protein